MIFGSGRFLFEVLFFLQGKISTYKKEKELYWTNKIILCWVVGISKVWVSRCEVKLGVGSPSKGRYVLICCTCTRNAKLGNFSAELVFIFFYKYEVSCPKTRFFIYMYYEFPGYGKNLLLLLCIDIKFKYVWDGKN